MLTRAKERLRVFVLKQMREETDEEELQDLAKNPFANLGLGDTGMEMTGVNNMGVARGKEIAADYKRPSALATLEEEDEDEEGDFKEKAEGFGFGKFAERN